MSQGYPWKLNTIGLSRVKRPSNSRSVEPWGCSEDGGCCQCLHRGHVAAGSQDHVGLLSAISTGPWPDAQPLGAVNHSLVDGGELEMLLLVRHDDVDVAGARQAVIRNRQERVRVRRQ